MDNAPPIIIKKVKGGGEQAHHGGAWKVAYADFVTAMMAFFLLLWLLSATTDEQKLGISNYFSPEAVSAGRSGAGGVLGGKSLAPDGAFTSIGGVAGGGIVVALPTSPGVVSEVEVDDGAEPTEAARTISQRQLDDLLAAREQQQFEEAEAILREAIQGVPELSELKNSLLVDQTPAGLRIQLVDQEQVSMFNTGSAEPLESTCRLARLMAQVVAKLPNKISVSGHTDATPYASADGYSNWELSSDRANAARRLLLESGLAAQRIALVQGKSDTEPLLPDNPTSPRNRRISIVLLRQGDSGGIATTGAGPTVGGHGAVTEQEEEVPLPYPERE